jgi:ABC-type glycerol-3-phosphate transport system substrate-binding protein
LREANTDLNKKQVLSEPYHDFNPREYYGKTTFNIQQLEEQLDDILEKWTTAMRSVFKDPSVQENMDILNANDKQLVEDFRTGKLELTTENAPLLRNLIAQFAQGIDKVEITMDDIRKQLNKPLTPQEAIDTLTSYIDGLCIGKERNKVRIIIK